MKEIRRLGIKGRKGVLGGLPSMFVATILVILILLIFVFISGITKTIGKHYDGTKVDEEGDVGVGDIHSYMDDFKRHAEARLREQGVSPGEVESGLAG